MSSPRDQDCCGRDAILEVSPVVVAEGVVPAEKDIERLADVLLAPDLNEFIEEAEETPKNFREVSGGSTLKAYLRYRLEASSSSMLI